MASSGGTLATAEVLVVGTAEWTDGAAEAIESEGGATVRRASSIGSTLEELAARELDGVLAGNELPDGDGVDLVRAIRDVSADLPVVLCAADGDEAVASEAIRAGVTDYVPLQDATSPPGDEVVDRFARAVHEARRRRTRRDRARQFDAVFRNGGTPTWVLDPAGRLERANETALEMVDVDPGSVVGDRFWSLPWFDRSAQVRSDVRQVVSTVIERRSTRRVVTEAGAPEPRTVELSVLPVEDSRGELAGIVVEGDDVTERVSLYRELRSSEELHRVTLNNMTDTVLLTDDEGAFTYVCPNVHFIFGYSVEEIRAMGTIDALLGEDLFEPGELEAEGVLKNIECTVADKAGRTHTLLVNVRAVSIQEGTHLYSCRDVTKRKQREEALATLQATARDFLYAETREEIARQLVDDVPGVLDLDASAVYRFDADGNELRPAASSTAFERLHGPLPPVPADGETLASYSFVEDESRYLDDVHDADRLANPATDLRSAAYIPLGDHGVFVAGSTDVGRFDGVTRELADLLAATAEAALDRVRRESRLREQERELKRRNSELTTLNRINEIIREIDQALVQAETRAEVEHAVCERLTADSRFAFAWIGAVDAGTVEPRAWAGDGRGYLDSAAFPVDEAAVEPAGRAAASGEVAMVTRVAEGLREEAWRKEALSRDFLSVLSVPIAYDGFAYGVLSVYADAQDAFDGTSRAVLAELGETVASATSAIERKNALLTSSMTRLEFDVDDPTFVLSRLAREAGCSLSYDGGVQQTEDGSDVFVTVEGAAVDAVEAAASDLVTVADVHRISADGSGGVLRLRLAEPFLAVDLADHGAVLRSASVDPDDARLVIDVPESVDVRHVTDVVSGEFADVELRSKGSHEREPTGDPSGRFLDRLTDRQREVIEVAYYSGFFESPRDSTGEEVAEALGISPQAFYKHARTVQRKLFSTVFDEGGVPRSDAA